MNRMNDCSKVRPETLKGIAYYQSEFLLTIAEEVLIFAKREVQSCNPEGFRRYVVALRSKIRSLRLPDQNAEADFSFRAEEESEVVWF